MIRYILLLLPLFAFSQHKVKKVFFTESNGEVKIYIDKYANSADSWITVNKTTPYFTSWEVVQHRNQADLVVELVEHRNLADRSVHIMTPEYKKCKDSECFL